MQAGGDREQPARVLVVDDEEVSRRLLAEIITVDGFEVLEAGGGRQALDCLERERVDLVLLDYTMPEIDGRAVLAELERRDMLAGLPVVVVSAHNRRAVRVEALRRGAIDFLPKPFDRIEVRAKVRALTELGRLRAANLVRIEDQTRRATRARIQSATEGLPLVIYELDVLAADRVSADWWIGDIEALLGITDDAFNAAHDPLERVHPDDRETTRMALERAIAGIQPSFANRLRVEVGGAYRWCLDTASYDPASRRLRGVIMQIDEQVAVEDRLRQAQKMEAVGQLAGGIAHDFNNILSAIVSFGVFARDGLADGDPRRDDIDEVLKAADRAVGLTRQLLTFSRRAPTSPRPVDLDDHLAALRNLLQRSVTEKVELELIASPRPAIINIDPVELDQLILNLAVNARDAMVDGGLLRIAVQADPPGTAGARVRLQVSDTGVGMDDAVRSRIFEPFFTTKALGRGTGIGLSTCFGIVEAAGGSLECDSAPGRGTTFRISFPACEGDARREPAAEPQGRIARGERVLLAEDDDALRRACTRALEAAGFEVEVAADGDAAIAIIDDLGDSLSAIVCDVVMPKKGGYDVAAHAARAAPRAAVILTSGYVDVSVDRSAAPELPVLAKPVSMPHLVAAVAEAIAPADGPAPEPERQEILIVEDDAAIRRAIVRILGRAGVETHGVGTVAAAIARLEHGPEPRAVLCDLQLEDGPGIEVLERIEAHHGGLAARTFLLTGGATDEAGARLLDSGRFEVLPKPIDPGRLLEVVSRPAPPPRAPEAGPIASAAATSSSSAIRVLLVDRDRALVSAWARALEREGFDVAAETSLAAARERLLETSPDAVVTDVKLDDGSGIELLRQAREIDPQLPVVLVTGGVTLDDVSEAVRVQATDFLTKPFGASRLVSTLRNVTDAHHTARLRATLLAAHSGGDELASDLDATEHHFDRALSGLRMVYQPIVRADGEVFAYEALLRSGVPALSPPPRLLAAAEVLGRIRDVGRAVRAAVAATIAEHADRGEQIFINVHSSELRADWLADPDDPLLPSASRVVLEVSERGAVIPGRALRGVRDLGYRIGIDDLGAGYAGLSILAGLRPDFAKLDMSLVRDVDRSPLKRSVIAGLVELARRYEITPIAEGVETTAEREALVAIGVELLQGHLFAMPGPEFARVAEEGAF